MQNERCRRTWHCACVSIALEQPAGRSMSTLIVGSQIALRPVTTDDAARLFVLVDANRAYLRAWLPWLDGSRCEADTLTFLTRVIEQEREGREATLLIEHEGALCGVVGLNRIDALNRHCEIGYWLAEADQGRGIMTACVERLVQHAFEDRQLNRVAIHVATDNTRSRAIPERLGFKVEGVMREAGWLYDHFVDLVLYAIVCSDWTARRA
jgi:ribosomal-protein-serine acetyltransferase